MPATATSAVLLRSFLMSSVRVIVRVEMRSLFEFLSTVVGLEAVDSGDADSEVVSSGGVCSEAVELGVLIHN